MDFCESGKEATLRTLFQKKLGREISREGEEVKGRKGRGGSEGEEGKGRKGRGGKEGEEMGPERDGV